MDATHTHNSLSVFQSAFTASWLPLSFLVLNSSPFLTFAGFLPLMDHVKSCPPVRVKCKHTIAPAVPSPVDSCFLSCLDRFWIGSRYNQVVFFYDLPPNDYPRFIRTLKQGLAFALVHFYPLAGRLARGANGRYQIVCSDHGVELLEASVDLSFSDLQNDGFQARRVFKELARMYVGDNLDKPPLSIQVTQFRDGSGVSLGVASNHVFMDGISTTHFLVSWAECCRGMSLTIPPDHSRAALKGDILLSGEEDSEIFIEGVEINVDVGLKTDQQPMSLKVFNFSLKMLKKLKDLANIEQVEDRSPISSFVAMCAHLWLVISEARQLDDAETVLFVTPVDGRSRLAPPLPQGYFGNTIGTAVLYTTAGELKQKSLPQVAQLIRDDIERCDDRRLREGIRDMELSAEPSMKRKREFKKKVSAVNVVGSPRLRTDKIDFGWGGPEVVRPTQLNCDGEVFAMPGPAGTGSVDATIALPTESMERLCKMIFSF